MNKLVWVVAAALLTGHASAQDYVARAYTTCAAVDGTARYAPCMTSAAQSICGSQAISERLSCFKDFERYALAKVDKIEAQRRALSFDVEQRMQRLRSKIQNTAADPQGGYFNPHGNTGRTLDDGLPDMQPSWGTGGDPYAHLRKFVAPLDATGVESRSNSSIVQVDAYYKKDGTFVPAHTMKAPTR